MPTNETERDERAMVRVLAERVMNWERPKGCFDYYHPKIYESGRDWAADGDWNPFTSWADAGMLLEALHAKGFRVDVEARFSGECICRILSPDDCGRGKISKTWQAAKSVPRAISLAAFEWGRGPEGAAMSEMKFPELKQPLGEWLAERRDNCYRIMEQKPESERQGWLEDAAYFEAARLVVEERYFIGYDNSSHKYYVPVEKREEFDVWSELPEDDERGWEQPDYAVRIDGRFTFTNPRCD